jgi:hypothetical protein
MRTAKDRRDAQHKIIGEAKAQRACELRQAGQRLRDLARQHRLLMLIMAGIALLGSYALHVGSGHAESGRERTGR